MRVLSQFLAGTVFVGGILAALFVGAAPASAQCGMNMGGAGHDHAAMQGDRAARSSGSEKKLRQSIERVLADDRGRAMLSDALLDDRMFMEAFVQRLTAIPEWRAMVSRRLAGTNPSAPVVREGNSTPVSPDSPKATFICPMHADVISAAPGSCPKCGMALVRKDAARE